MKTLMHICCAPCANRPIAALREEGIEQLFSDCLDAWALPGELGRRLD